MRIPEIYHLYSVYVLLKREVWVVKTGHSHFLNTSQYYKFSDKMNMLVLFPLLLIFLSIPGS